MRLIEFLRFAFATLVAETPLRWRHFLQSFGIAGFAFTVVRLALGGDSDHVRWATGTMVLTFLATICASHLNHLSNERILSFKVKSFEEGRGAYEDLINARTNVSVTHFSTIQPTRSYIQLMLDKIDEGLHVKRFLPEEARDKKGPYKWLKKFKSRLGHGYEEIIVKTERPPFDIFIFDDTITTIQLPRTVDDNTFSLGLRFDSRRVAEQLRDALHRFNERAEARAAEDEDVGRG